MGAVEVGEPETIASNGEEVELTPVSVGNPHAVIRRDPDRGRAPAPRPAASRTHERFPERTNVQLVRVGRRCTIITVGVWERGAGETLSSGTSAVAASAAARRERLVREPGDGAPRRRRTSGSSSRTAARA